MIEKWCFDISECDIATSKKELGYFSVSSDEEFRIDKSSLKYLYEFDWDDVNIDLKVGFDQFKNKCYHYPYNIELLLKWCTREGKDKPKSPLEDFICCRGLLKTIATSIIPSTPINKPSKWKFAVKKFKGSFYMVELQEFWKLKSSLWETASGYGGYKFKQHLTVDEPGMVPDTSTIIDKHPEFHLVYRHQVGEHSILCSGPIDCISQKENEGYTEIKSYYKKRNAEWWGQAEFLGIKKIVMGGKKEDNIVCIIEKVDVETLLKPGERNACFNFLNGMLDFVKKVMAEADEDEVYSFERVDDEIHAEVINDVGIKRYNKFEGREFDEDFWRYQSNKTIGEYLNLINAKVIANILPAWYVELMRGDSKNLLRGTL